MKTDRELLELAAKAAGMNTREFATDSITRWHWRDDGTYTAWNPLTDDGDALRLAVKLQLAVRPSEKCVFIETNPDTLLSFSSISELEMYGSDPYAATRRAITRAAAAIGESGNRCHDNHHSHTGAPAMTDKIREEFEKWALSNDGPSVSVMRNEVGRYEDEELNMAWLAWQAARTVPEVITTAKMYHEVAQRLYALLDDIDTAGDIAKGDDALYRKIVERTQSKKGTFVIYCDGQTVRLVDDAMLSIAQEPKK